MECYRIKGDQLGTKTLEKQNAVYNYIVSYVERNGYTPTVREMCSGTGIKSTSTIHFLLINLSNQGLIRVSEGPRAIKLIGYKLIKE